MERRKAGLKFRIVRGCGQEHADAPYPDRQLRTGGARPKYRRRGRRAAEEGDEFAPSHLGLPC
jgi:hypothetical protein